MEFTNADVLAEVLAHAVTGEYRVIEFRTSNGQTTAADITEHVRALEAIAEGYNRGPPPDGVDD